MIEIARDAPGSVACGSREVTLFDIESQAELDSVQRSLPWPQPAPAPHPQPDPDKGLL
jgi:hypothetical protein